MRTRQHGTDHGPEDFVQGTVLVIGELHNFEQAFLFALRKRSAPCTFSELAHISSGHSNSIAGRESRMYKNPGTSLWIGDGLVSNGLSSHQIFFQQNRRKRQHVTNIIEPVADII